MKVDLINQIKTYLGDKYEVDLSHTLVEEPLIALSASYDTLTDKVETPKFTVAIFAPMFIIRGITTLDPLSLYFAVVTTLSIFDRVSSTVHELTHAATLRINRDQNFGFRESIAIYEQFTNSVTTQFDKVKVKSLHYLFPFVLVVTRYRQWSKLFNLIDLDKDTRYKKLKIKPSLEIDKSVIDNLVNISHNQMVVEHKSLETILKYL